MRKNRSSKGKEGQEGEENHLIPPLLPYNRYPSKLPDISSQCDFVSFLVRLPV